MVRTLADGGSKKAVAAKAPRKQLGCSSGGSSNVYSSSPSNNSNFGLSNHARLWPTPTWQKGINNFFKKCEKAVEEDPSSSTSDQSDSCERMESNDVVITSTACSGSSSGGGGSSSSSTERIYSDEEDKENIDPSSSPERLTTKMNGSDGSESPSPKPRRKQSGKQKAAPCKKKKRMVLQEDSDYDE